jgi:SAM-dependent methyltransferase
MMHQVKKMLLRDSDVEWEKFGRTDPYYGVLSCERFHIDKMDDDSLADFFESGQRQIDFILETIRSSIDPEFAPRRALDFGCGVGRCAIALARACETVTGVDVSNSMLREAEKRSAEQSIKNLRFLQSADDLSCLAGQFDLIHSSLVFQHINQKRGMRIFARLVDLLSDNGVGAVQFIYDRSESALVRQMGNLRRAIPVWHPLSTCYMASQLLNRLWKKMSTTSTNFSPCFARMVAVRCICDCLSSRIDGAPLFFSRRTKKKRHITCTFSG